MSRPQIIDGEFSVLTDGQGDGASPARPEPAVAQWLGVVVAVVVLRLAAGPLFNLFGALDHALFGLALVHH